MPDPTRLRLDVSYDGTDFSGWAAQPDRRTVAGVLQHALDQLFAPARGRRTGDAPDGAADESTGAGESGADAAGAAGGATGLTVAGRTDAGVHATGQVCHVDVPADRYTLLAGTLLRRLNGLLPADVRVRRVAVAPDGFDARFSALSRRYEYRVCDAPYGVEPLRRRDTLAWAYPLDLARLNEAGARLLGEHDFAAYCRRKEHATTIRAVSALRWRRDPDGVVVATVAADAFCQAMVRSLVGALLPVGDGRRPVDWPAGLLQRRQRANEVVVVPPHGLTLVEVRYPEDPAQYAARAQLTRRRRD